MNDKGKKIHHEIGSYFWLEDQPDHQKTADYNKWLPICDDSALTFSGRGAITTALEDILCSRRITRIYMPSYCCESMLQPFWANGIEIEYYEVTFENGEFHYKFEFNKKAELALVMSYFGFSTYMAHDLIEHLSNKGICVIEDITHSLFNKYPSSEKSDYIVASLRKWFPIPTGGWVGKKDGNIVHKPYICGDNYVNGKIDGMKEKCDYLNGIVKDKNNYLRLQGEFESLLDKINHTLSIDKVSREILLSLDIADIAKKRRSNASILYSKIQEIDDKRITLPKFNSKEDVPLFLPVFLKNADRDSLRACLLNKDIYCPVHWPDLPDTIGIINKRELSLICDQRYDCIDMDKIVDVIHEWTERDL